MFVVDDKIHSIQRSELSSVEIIIRGICLFGGRVYNLGCLVGVILQ